MAESKKKSRSLAGIAGIVAAATLLSKVFGLFRQVAIAAAFGQGAITDAYNYAYIVPGFFLILLGGINGPFHSAIVSVISKRKQEEIAPIVETINTFVCGILTVLMIALIFFAEPLIDLCAPGLGRTEIGMQTRAIAIEQFRIMAPMTVLAGLIGIGFGTLNAADQYWLPSVSPMLSSLTVLIGMGVLVLQLGDRIVQPEYAMLSGAVLAWSTLAGAVLQWLVQIPAQWRSGLGRPRLRFDFHRPEVQQVIRLMGPATFSSGMLQINVYTDLFFASGIPKAATALGNASLLVQTPLGIISNIILVPLFPIFSRLADPENWEELKQRIRQGLILTGLTMLPLSAIFITLALPIVRAVYERGSFTLADSQLVATVFIAYSIGMFVYLARDILIRVFYALGDGDTPFRISVVNIFLNAFFDWLWIKPFGAAGLVVATVSVNLISTVWLLLALDRKLHFPWRTWTVQLAGLLLCSLMGGATSWGVELLLKRQFGQTGFFLQLLQVSIAGALGLLVFTLLVLQLRLPEFNQLVDRIRQRFNRS